MKRIHTKANGPDNCTWIAYCDTPYESENLSLTMKQQIGDSKETETISVTLEGFPLESEFPGGCNWVDENGSKVDNPYYVRCLKYFKDHEIAQRRRNGEREFICLARPDAEKRGPILPSEATIRKQWIARRVKDKGISVEAATEQWESFNS